MAQNVKISPIGILDMLKFKNLPKQRRKVIEKSPATPLPKEYGSNKMARLLHPRTQSLMISKVVEQSPDAKTYTLESIDGSSLGYFRAGQYLSITLEINGSKLTRPYSINSSPREALQGRYELTIKATPQGFASQYILENWKVGTELTASGAQGDFYFDGLRDGSKVIALAGGSGITPFLSMARAISKGEENFELIILYGNRYEKDILFRQELDQLTESCPNVSCLHILSDEKKDGFLNGFITADLIKEQMKDNTESLFLCGSQGFYKFMDQELKGLDLPRRRQRKELFGVEKEPWVLPGYPQECKDKEFSLTVHNCGTTHEIPCAANESVLVALERAGIAAPSRCRSGECGYCHSRLVNGDVFVPKDTDGRRMGDLVYGYIHPCASFAISDLTIELPGSY